MAILCKGWMHGVSVDPDATVTLYVQCGWLWHRIHGFSLVLLRGWDACSY